MLCVITAAEVARLDDITDVPPAVLMERAGLAVALAAVRLGAGYGARVVVLAGKGKNGGDGYVAARYLRQRGVDVVVRCLAYPKGDPLVHRAMAIAAFASGVGVTPIGAPEPADLVIDALFGVGFHGTLPDTVLPWLDHAAPVLAVDVPSGLDATTGAVDGRAFRAAATVTFHAHRTGQLVGRGPEHCGAIEVVDIGLRGEEAAWLLVEDSDAVLPVRPVDAHKWSAGSVAVLGGSVGITGAPMLAARAALSFGAGAVRALLPDEVRAEAAAMDPGVMTEGIDRSGLRGVLVAASRCDVLLIGPGLGDATDLARGVTSEWAGPLVIDADAIGAVTPDILKGRTAPTVITPHAAEFERLTGEPASPQAAARLADDTGTVVVLKGAPTFVMGRGRQVVTSGGPELATIGTGDVLAGMIGALIARGAEAEAAAYTAAHLHGRAGASLARRRTVTATALAEEVGRFAW